MKSLVFLMAGIIGIIVSLTGCAGNSVKRTQVDEVIDFSGRWNDTDSRLVAQEMIKDCLNRSWVGKFNKKSGRDPVVIVGAVKNRSHEHVDAQLFVKNLEQSLLNSGKVQFVASKDERDQVREERKEQQTGWTSPKTIKQIGEETGADFMLIGSINSLKDEARGKYAILYQVNLELVDMTTNQKVWIGQKEIKKVVSKSKYSL